MDPRNIYISFTRFGISRIAAAKAHRRSGPDKETLAILSSMQTKALLLLPLVASVAAIAAVGPVAVVKRPAVVRMAANQAQQPVYTPAPVAAPPSAYSSRIGSALVQWNNLRQTDALPFSTYAAFLTRYRGWPGEASLRKTAEKAIDPATSSPSEVVNFFRILPPVSATGQARYATALLATGDVAGAQAAAKKAWAAGTLLKADEDRLLGMFGSAFLPDDHDRRIERLLSDRDVAGATRLLGFASAARRPFFDARLAMQTRAPDASVKVALLGNSANGDPGFLRDRARWLRDTSQNMAARTLLAQPHSLTKLPIDAEKWFETLLDFARGAAADKQWSLAYQIASQVDDAYPAGTDITLQSMGERDDYTSLTWLAGTVALHQLNRPADAEAMFLRYAKGGRSTQVTTKGYYWAGRAALAAGHTAAANGYFEQAATVPELFYGQLALERLGRSVPAPLSSAALPAPTPAERTAFNNRDIVQAVRTLGQMGRWDDQSLFIRTLSEQADTQQDRVLTAELSRSLGRPDLAVWLARSARNAGNPFYVSAAYPEVSIPPNQMQFWSLAHGIMRQESSFDRGAVSHAGARGMMQLMPGTARQTASKLGLSYDVSRLTREPEYNVLLGTQYFSELMAQWGNSAPLALASYNAGTGNVRKWIAANGDPRLPGADIVKWIEDIPFLETRGYVQRTLENTVVYDSIRPERARSNGPSRLSYYLGKSARPG